MDTDFGQLATRVQGHCVNGAMRQDWVHAACMESEACVRQRACSLLRRRDFTPSTPAAATMPRADCAGARSSRRSTQSSWAAAASADAALPYRKAATAARQRPPSMETVISGGLPFSGRSSSGPGPAGAQPPRSAHAQRALSFSSRASHDPPPARLASSGVMFQEPDEGQAGLIMHDKVVNARRQEKETGRAPGMLPCSSCGSAAAMAALSRRKATCAAPVARPAAPK